jgi:hypothetical protein
VNLLVADKTWVFARALEGRAAVVAFNTAPDRATLDVPAGPAGLAEGALLTDRLGSGAAARVEGGRLRLSLASGASAVLLP